MAVDDLTTLIARARRHDESALTELLNNHAQRLLDSIRAELGERLRQRLESQDVLQQVYLDALHSIDRFVDRGQDSFFAWLRQIALNRICDADRRAFQTVKRGAEIRAADLGQSRALGALFEAVAASCGSPSGVADLAEREGLLRNALEQLSPDQRRAIELRYLHQLSVAEAAVKMDRTEPAVRSLCVRALIRLRELLGDAI
ncbi:MAG: RNA polymerase sigma factor [Planctomycetota bacterium]